MKLKTPGLLRDKRMQIGVAAAAGLGLIALLRKRSSASAGTDGGSGSTPQSITPAVMDSSGTDTYNAIASLGQGWENDLRDYTSKLDSLSTQVANNTTGLKTVNTAVGKLGQTKTVASTVGFQAVKLDKGGILGVGKKYGLKTSYIMALPQNAALRGLKPAQAVGKTVYIPGGYRPKVVAKPKKK